MKNSTLLMVGIVAAVAILSIGLLNTYYNATSKCTEHQF